MLNKSILSFKEAVEYLNVSASFLYKMTYSRKITHYKPVGSKLIYFKRDDLDKWLLGVEIRSIDTQVEEVVGNGKKK